MKSLKLILLGIAVILFGISASLLSGLDLPTLHNGIFELLGVLCPIVGVGLSVAGFICKDGRDKR